MDEEVTSGTNIVRLNDVKNMSEIEAIEASIYGIQEEIHLIDAAQGMDQQKRQRTKTGALKRLAAAQHSLEATKDRISRKASAEAKVRSKAREKATKEAAKEREKQAKERDKAAKEHADDVRAQVKLTEKAAAKAAQEEAAAESAQELLAKHRQSLNYLLDDTDLYWVLTADKYFQFLNGKWHPITPKALKTNYPMLTKMEAVFAFDEVMIDANRKYIDATFTFRDVPSYTLNMLRTNFVERVDDGQPVHWFFRVLMDSLGGGRQENADHIEALLARKYCEPWDYMLPALVLENPPGGCGKGILGGKLAPTLFGANAVADNISMKDFIGQFNSHVMGKVMLVINETIEDKYDDNRLKQMLHSPTVMGEQKFMPRMVFDNTAMVVICGNGATGAVKLAGNDIDRRVSVVRALRTLDSWVAEHEGISLPQAKLMIRNNLQHVLTDPIEVGRWIDQMIKKWEHLPMITGLHGVDYDHFVAVQEPFYYEVFGAVFTEPGFSHIRTDTLFDLFVHFNKEKNHSFSKVRRKTFNEHADYWVSRHLNGIVERQKVHTPTTTINGTGRTTMDVWTVVNNPKTLTDNDFRYFVKQDGRIEWKFRM